MGNLLNFRLPNRRQLLPIGLLFTMMSLELAVPAEAIESQIKINDNPAASVASDLPEENLVARRCRFKTVIRRRSRIVRRCPCVFRGRRYGRNFVIRRITRRPVRVRVCR
jgi:hypothetical protein